MRTANLHTVAVNTIRSEDFTITKVLCEEGQRLIQT